MNKYISYCPLCKKKLEEGKFSHHKRTAEHKRHFEEVKVFLKNQQEQISIENRGLYNNYLDFILSLV